MNCLTVSTIYLQQTTKNKTNYNELTQEKQLILAVKEYHKYKQ